MSNLAARVKLIEKIITKLAIIMAVFTLAVAFVIVWFTVPGYSVTKAINIKPSTVESTGDAPQLTAAPWTEKPPIAAD